MGVKVRKKGDTWYVFINHGKRRKAKAVGSKGAAEAVAAKIQAKLTLGQFEIPDTDTGAAVLFRDYARKWLAMQVHLKHATVIAYERNLCGHVLPTFAETPVAKITREGVRDFVAGELAKGLKPRSLRVIMAPFRSCLAQAVDDGLLAGNPAARIGKFLARRKAELGEEKPDPFTAEELALMLEIVRERWPRDYPHILCLARTGMRPGESFALEGPDLDIEGRCIRVAKNWSAGELTTPKSGKTRWVDMSDQLAEVLRQHREVQAAEAAVRGTDPPALVFPSLRGRHWHPFGFSHKVWTPLLRLAGVRHRGPHHLRHTYASLLLGDGVPVTYVSEQLGHSSPRITFDVYARWVPRGTRAEVNRLDEMPPAGATGRNPRATAVGGPSAVSRT
jgi:integrase